MADIVPNLAQLAEQINAEHQQVETALRAGLEHAKRAGELLLEAKQQCHHGEWLPWLGANVEFSERTAQAYMRVASRWDELTAKAQHVADLPYREAIGLLAKPAEEVDIDANLEEAIRLLREVAEEFPYDLEAWTLESLQEVIRLAKECIRHAHAVKVDAELDLGGVLKEMKRQAEPQ
jgi:hypothetical protein